MRYKIQIFLVTGVLLLGSAFVEKPVEFNPVGTWEGENGGEKIQFVLQPDGTCALVFKKSDEVLQVNGDCEFDFSKRPIPLMIRNIPQLTHPLHTIVDFKGTDEILMGSFSPSWRLRPITFEPGRSFYLRRVS